MDHFFSIFIGLSLVSLLIMLWSDLQKQKIDERRNYFMFGATVTIGLVMSNASMFFWGAITLMAFWVLFTQLERFIGKQIGDGDKQVFAWLLPGLAMFNPLYAVLCLGLFFGFSGLFSIYLLWVKRVGRYPGIVFIGLGLLVTLFLVV